MYMYISLKLKNSMQRNYGMPLCRASQVLNKKPAPMQHSHTSCGRSSMESLEGSAKCICGIQ